MKRLRRPSGELIAYIVLVLVALGLRLYQLGDRPFHHDESQDAYFSWILWTKGDYKYQPILHGPLRFYLTASIFSLFGDSNFTARLAPATSRRSASRCWSWSSASSTARRSGTRR